MNTFSILRHLLTARSLFIFTCVVCWTYSPQTFAKQKSWYKYENNYFEVFSSASERKVRKILEDLENFRAAVIQSANITIPEDASKTQVYILDSRTELTDITNNRNYGGFAIRLEDTPYIFMPVGGGGKSSRTTMRHEFTHILMGYSKVTYPSWFKEGFAEFLSGTRIVGDGRQFTYGEKSGRTVYPVGLISWRTLISDDFQFHSIGNNGARVSNAYLQAWLLTHYFVLGDQAAHYDKLKRYFVRLRNGEPSIQAFIAETGLSPDQLGRGVLDTYSKRTPHYIIDFKTGLQDHNFDKSSAAPETVESVLETMRAQFSR